MKTLNDLLRLQPCTVLDAAATYFYPLAHAKHKNSFPVRYQDVTTFIGQGLCEWVVVVIWHSLLSCLQGHTPLEGRMSAERVVLQAPAISQELSLESRAGGAAGLAPVP